MRGKLHGEAVALDQAGAMARMNRPRTVVVSYRGIPYELDLVRCRRGLVNRQVDGDLDSMESLAQACGISRSTASRFFSGRATSLTVTLKILETLHLRFEDVAKPVELPGAA
jgi:Helix-turn-helix